MKTILWCILMLVLGQVNASEFRQIALPKSKILAEMPEITVALPLSYESDKTKRYPVIYVLDGESNGVLVSGMLQRLHISDGAFEHIIVGVTSKNRLRDFAPTVNLDPRGPVGEGGGGEQFLDYMQQELVPEIDTGFRTIDYKVLAGHSVAGLLVVHSFQSRPRFFQAHMAFSPAVWWGNRETADATKGYVTSSKHVEGYLYMNIGSESGSMRQVYDSLADTIMRNRNLDLSLRLDEFDDEAHDFTLAAGLYNALKGLHQRQLKQGI